MVSTETGKSGLALLSCGVTNLYPKYCGIGSGSGAVLNTNIALIAEVGSRTDYTTRDVSIQKEVTWVHDFSAVSMSGINLKEFGIFDTNIAASGTMFHREGFSSVTFDGTNELQTQVTFKYF